METTDPVAWVSLCASDGVYGRRPPCQAHLSCQTGTRHVQVRQTQHHEAVVGVPAQTPVAYTLAKPHNRFTTAENVGRVRLASLETGNLRPKSIPYRERLPAGKSSQTELVDDQSMQTGLALATRRIQCHSG